MTLMSPPDLVVAVHAALRQAGATLATAESLTGGALAARLTSVSGASTVYLGGVVAYATSLKTGVLGVDEEIVLGSGAVSAPCAEAMAVGVRGLTGATYAVSTTGVAGPDPQEGKPVGTVFVGVSGPRGSMSRALALSEGRSEICESTVMHALSMIHTQVVAGQTEQNRLR